MADLSTISVTAPDPTAPEGHEAAMVAKVDAAALAADPPAPDAGRPSWLPEKFKSVEDMATAYAALETKLGTPAAAKPAAAAVVPPVVPPVADAAAEAAKAAGLDMAALRSEFAESGKLSDASTAKLAAAGFDQATIDGYIAGQRALSDAYDSDVKSATPGGADKFGEMIAWAKVGLTASEVTAFNTAVSSGNADVAKLAVAGLGTKFTAAVGNEPTLVGGRVNASASDQYESLAQMKADMAMPIYKVDPAFRAKVQAKIGRSSIL